MLSDSQVWTFVNKWIDINSITINKFFYKYGWITSSVKEDVYQDIYLECFDRVRNLERKNKDIDLEVLLNCRVFRNKVLGNYRAKSWQRRSDITLRISDVYKTENDEVENISLFLNKDISDMENYLVIKKEENNDENIKYKRADIKEKLRILMSILPTKYKEIFIALYTGEDDNGFLSSREAGERFNLKQNSVNKGIQHCVSFIKAFLKENNIDFNTPTSKLKEYVNNYKIHKRIKDNTCVYLFNIEDFLEEFEMDTS